MESLHLTSYIASDIFLWDIKEKDLHFDAIFTDVEFQQSEIPVFSPRNKLVDDDLLSFWRESLKSLQKPLFILNNLNIWALKPLFDILPSDTVIINLNVGIWSISRKLTFEWNDLLEIPDNFSAYEPLDLMNLFQQLESTGGIYIRIPHQDFSVSIFNTPDIGIIDAQVLDRIDMLNLKWYGYAGLHWTILSSGANFGAVLQLGDFLQKASRDMDIFITEKIFDGTKSDFFSFSPELIDSLHQTKKLFIVMDIKPSETFHNRLLTALRNAELADIAIEWLTPSYEHLTTVLDEYTREQAEFDAGGLLDRILKI